MFTRGYHDFPQFGPWKIHCFSYFPYLNISYIISRKPKVPWICPHGWPSARFFMKVDGKFREVEAAAQLAFAKIMGSAEGKTGQNAAFPAGWNDG